MIRIISIITSQYIPAGRTLHWSTDNTEFIYVEAFTSLQANWNNSHATLYAEDCLFTQGLALHNSSPSSASIRAIRLQVEQKIASRLASNVSSLQSAETALLKELFSPLFLDHSQIAETEELASRLFKTWSFLTSPGVEPFPVGLHGQMDPRLIKVNRYLRSHCEETISLQQLADLIQCNPVYLSNMYSKVFHISPMKHVQKMKMEKAKKLLLSTNMSVREVAQRLGYISPSQFSDLFKRHNGVTPLLFRRNSRLIDHDR